MDFFAREDLAHRNSHRLVVLFVLAILLTLLAINLVAYWCLEAYLSGGSSPYRAEMPAAAADELRVRVHVLVTIGALLIITAGTAWKTLQLRAGGTVVAAMLGGRLVDRDTRDPRERRLLNVVEEMAIASGVPMPEVYVLPQEDGLNAFAAGHHPQDAVIAVTNGCLTRLSRDELQGVIGHEFSHLLNGDMRFNLRLIGLVHGLLVIALTGQVILRVLARARSGGSGRGKGGGAIIPILLIAVALVVIGYIGYFFGQLIKAAVSRQREFLADASSAQFTRNPPSLAGALKQIGSSYHGAFVRAERSHEISHLFFGNAVGDQWFSPLATHPPIEARIRLLDPQWDGTYPPVKAEAPADDQAPERGTAAFVRPPAPAGTAFVAGATVATLLTLRPEQVSARVGTVSPEHVVYGAALLNRIPAALGEAARQPYSARAVVFALLLDPDPAKAAAQLDLLEHGPDPAVATETRRLQRELANLEVGAPLPLIDLCIPALRRMSPLQTSDFLGLVQMLVRADQQVSLREYIITKLLQSHLTRTARPGGGIFAMKPLLPHLAVLFSALARAGNDDAEAARAAFAAATAKVVLPGETLDFLPSAACGVDQLDQALDQLMLASPGLKRRLVTACAWCVAADGTVTPQEAELLRVICDCLGCPMPPFADTAEATAPVH